jgi:uncharacterized protein (DUF427 family)
MRVRITFDGQVIADTLKAVRLDESGYAPVYYIPRQDVDMTRLVRSDHRTYCPFKGHASYYALATDGRIEQNAVWTYEQPFDEVEVIRGLLAFYPKKVDRIEALPA